MFIQQLLFLDISGGEFLVILLAIFLVFGPKKMPEMARKIGRAMNELKKASSDITREFSKETESITREISNTREMLRKEGEALRNGLLDTEKTIEKNLDISPEAPANWETEAKSVQDAANDDNTAEASSVYEDETPIPFENRNQAPPAAEK